MRRWLADIFGCQNWSGAIQDVGSVETREGRLITFPNVLQHRVLPFKLADPTKAWSLQDCGPVPCDLDIGVKKHCTRSLPATRVVVGDGDGYINANAKA